MNRDNRQSNDTGEIKKPITLDSIPEDCALIIANLVKGWAAIEGSLEEKEKARRARDATLRAAALSCRRNHSLYFPILIQDVSIAQLDLFNFLESVQRGMYGDQVRSLRLKATVVSDSLLQNPKTHFFYAKAVSLSTLPKTAESLARFLQGVNMVMGQVYDRLIGIETLIIEAPKLSFGFRQVPHLFLVKSLKRLFFGETDDKDWNLSTKNAVWLLLFCPKLDEACLAIAMKPSDLSYLVEFGEAIAGKSPVKKLALKLAFGSDELPKKTSWTWHNSESSVVSRLLTCTNQIQSLELFNAPDTDGLHPRFLTSNCLLGLYRSFDSLRHLRIMGIVYDQDDPAPACYSNFKGMRVLTADANVFIALKSSKSLLLPPNLEILFLPYHTDKAEDEAVVVSAIHSRAFSTLQEVIVPLEPIASSGKPSSEHNMELWLKHRRRLETDSNFTSGRVKLRKIGRGESVGDDSKGEVFMSTLEWLYH